MKEIVIALILILNGNVIEHTYKGKMSDCLKSKRLAMREVNPENVRFICKKTKALTEASMKLGEAVYKDMQQQQEEPKKEEKKKDDNVVDADFEDVTPEVDSKD